MNLPPDDAASSPRRRARRTASVGVRRGLVDAAVRLVEREGLKGLTVRAVASEAQVAPMGVYNHLAGKRGLLAAVVADGFEDLAAAVAWNSDLGPYEAFMAAGWAYRDFALRRPVAYGMMFDCAVAPGSVLDAGAPAFEALVDGIRRLQKAGLLGTGDATMMAMSVWSALHGAVSLELTGRRMEGVGEDRIIAAELALQLTLQTIVRGLRAQ